MGGEGVHLLCNTDLLACKSVAYEQRERDSYFVIIGRRNIFKKKGLDFLCVAWTVPNLVVKKFAFYTSLWSAVLTILIIFILYQCTPFYLPWLSLYTLLPLISHFTPIT